MAGYKLTKTHVVSETGEASIITGREGLAIPTADTYLTVGQVEKLTGTRRADYVTTTALAFCVPRDLEKE